MNRLALYHIETLLWIARLGTFSAAADRLNTTQPTISARVREIEGHFSYPLFRREGRNMILTVRGRQLVADFEELWGHLETILAPMDTPENVSGIVRLGCGEIASILWLPKILGELNNRFPKLQIDVNIDISVNLQRQLEEGKIDIALLVGPVQERSLKSNLIGSSRLCWYVSPARNKVSPFVSRHDLFASTPIWSLPRLSHLHQHISEMLRSAGISPSAISTCNNLRTMIEVIMTGSGTAMLPENMVDQHVANGNLMRLLLDDEITIDFYAAIRRGVEERAIMTVYRCALAQSDGIPPAETV